jgi:hypothetical protein
MRTQDTIDIGDIVKVNFHNAQFTLCKNAKVLYKPCATGDSWIFEDVDTGKVHYVSEGCTITKIVKKEPVQTLDKTRPIAECKKHNVLPAIGTPVKIGAIDPPDKCGGFLVKQKHIDARKAGIEGIYHGYVPGAGGDVWWVLHPDQTIGAYLSTEVFDP